MDRYSDIFIVGIKGAAMANIAVILKQMGKNVRGSDTGESFITDVTLEKHGIEVLEGFEAGTIQGSDLVIYSAAHSGTQNPQVEDARKRKIAVMSQAEFLGKLTAGFENTIAVAGTHGKTTTSSLLSHALVELGAHPSYLVGTSNFGARDGGSFDGKKYFVIEADEYAVSPPSDLTPKFLSLTPQFILATNIDFDHPDVFKNLQEVQNSFGKLLRKGSAIFACADDIPLMEVVSTIHTKHIRTFGFREDATARISAVTADQTGTLFDLMYEGSTNQYRIPLYGDKNISNAAGVILTLIELGYAPEQIARAIRSFKGPKRRFEFVADKGGTLLFDDYAHHPAEIRATIEAARSAFPARRIGLVFQPHTYSRTRMLLADFGEALSEADYAIVAPIFASAREKAGGTPVSASDIAHSASKKGEVEAADTKEAVLTLLASKLKIGDVVFTMGAGDIYELKNGIISIIESAAVKG